MVSVIAYIADCVAASGANGSMMAPLAQHFAVATANLQSSKIGGINFFVICSTPSSSIVLTFSTAFTKSFMSFAFVFCKSYYSNLEHVLSIASY